MFSSGTLGFCFIFRSLFGYGGTFTHVFWPMQGSPPRPAHGGIPSEPLILTQSEPENRTTNSVPVLPRRPYRIYSGVHSNES
jgi:hypothetical protein